MCYLKFTKKYIGSNILLQVLSFHFRQKTSLKYIVSSYVLSNNVNNICISNLEKNKKKRFLCRKKRSILEVLGQFFEELNLVGNIFIVEIIILFLA